ncbi:MAG: ABC transporter substrate-binding protein [Hyphomicrobiales bacterium]
MLTTATKRAELSTSSQRLFWTYSLALFTFVLVLSPLNPAFAQSGAEKAAIRQVESLLKSAHRSSGSLGGLRSVVSRHFAVGTWTNATLGKAGRKITSGQRSQVRKLLPSYIAKQYFKQFSGSGSRAGSVVKARTVRRDILVTSKIPSRSRTFTVVWRMRVIGGKPRVIDYVTGGVSAVILRRSEFGGKIKQSGGAGLVRFLKKFIAS